jgi:hypothetical protein
LVFLPGIGKKKVAAVIAKWPFAPIESTERYGREFL